MNNVILAFWWFHRFVYFNKVERNIRAVLRIGQGGYSIQWIPMIITKSEHEISHSKEGEEKLCKEKENHSLNLLTVIPQVQELLNKTECSETKVALQKIINQFSSENLHMKGILSELFCRCKREYCTWWKHNSSSYRSGFTNANLVYKFLPWQCFRRYYWALFEYTF